ncbi:hypothetical protein D6D21_09251 [Aureobasidium pullulans]|uniref:F-box domain-containing protein n=1 Tax=Aureobasidium pullulans TaxID=5580 RepID=A0AB74ILW1_AURPU|nr:hypothetical protein D6D21_09251 [Aureobasidium pullulans]
MTSALSNESLHLCRTIFHQSAYASAVYFSTYQTSLQSQKPNSISTKFIPRFYSLRTPPQPTRASWIQHAHSYLHSTMATLLDTLPTELVLKVIGHLSPTSARNAVSVMSDYARLSVDFAYFNAELNDSQLVVKYEWANVDFHSRSDSDVLITQNRGQPVINGFVSAREQKPFNTFTHHQSLMVTCAIVEAGATLTRLDLHGEIHSDLETIIELMNQCDNIVQLFVSSCTAVIQDRFLAEFLDGVKWSRLKALDIRPSVPQEHPNGHMIQVIPHQKQYSVAMINKYAPTIARRFPMMLEHDSMLIETISIAIHGRVKPSPEIIALINTAKSSGLVPYTGSIHSTPDYLDDVPEFIHPDWLHLNVSYRNVAVRLAKLFMKRASTETRLCEVHGDLPLFCFSRSERTSDDSQCLMDWARDEWKSPNADSVNMVNSMRDQVRAKNSVSRTSPAWSPLPHMSKLYGPIEPSERPEPLVRNDMWSRTFMSVNEQREARPALKPKGLALPPTPTVTRPTPLSGSLPRSGPLSSSLPRTGPPSGNLATSTTPMRPRAIRTQKTQNRDLHHASRVAAITSPHQKK